MVLTKFGDLVMLFTSLEFLFLFFPITLAIYFFLPQKARNYWLLVVSLLFYAWGEPVFLIAMVASIVFNYFVALRISECKPNVFQRKLMMFIAVIGNLGLLFVYKYMNFTTATLHRFFPSTEEMFSVTNFVLPIGISFFTFQALSYVIDVYRGIPVQKNIFYLGLYISFFPQLIAGPIVRYTTIAEQIENRTVTKDGFAEGIKRFLYGFNKKVLLSNLLAIVADYAFGNQKLSVVMAWLGIICYTLQIYFDFSGYSEMAIGLGRMFGFEFLENFNYPYISKTITEFWRRWHISLGSWFRDYVYFPLGGSRVKSKLRMVFNLFVTWFATGVWHGASWNFILWGVLYGVIITVEKLISIPKLSENKKVFSVFYQIFTMFMVMFGWVLFRAENLSAAIEYFKAMFGFAGNSVLDTTAIFYLKEYCVIIIFGILASTPIFKFIWKKIDGIGKYGAVLSSTLEKGVQLILFIISISFLVMNAHNPFIYFNF